MPLPTTFLGYLFRSCSGVIILVIRGNSRPCAGICSLGKQLECQVTKSHIFQGQLRSSSQYIPILSGWWYTYPSEKYESQLGLLFPMYGKS